MSIDDSQATSIPATIAANDIGELRATVDTVPGVNGAKHDNDLITHADSGSVSSDVAAITKSVRNLSESASVSAPEADATALDDKRVDAAAGDSAIKSPKIPSKAPKVVSHKTKTSTKKAAINDEDLAADILGALALDDINDTTGVGSQQDNIHIRVQQRNGRKVLTKIENIHKKYDLRKLEKELKRELQCGGSLVRDAEGKAIVIQLNGDHRHSAAKWILDQLDVEKDSIVIHGF